MEQNIPKGREQTVFKDGTESENREARMKTLSQEIARIDKQIEKKQDAVRSLTSEIEDLDSRKEVMQKELTQLQGDALIVEIQELFRTGSLCPADVDEMLFSMRKGRKPHLPRKKQDKDHSFQSDAENA